MLLAYQEKPSFYAVGEKLGMHHQTVQRCVERALVYGALRHSMTDRGHHAGSQGRLVSLACDKAKEHGYAHESWTTRLLARHAREHGPAAGHECLARLVQGTVCKILGQEEIKPHKVRYYRSPRRRRICRPSPACTRPSRARRTREPFAVRLRLWAGRRSAASPC
jgi:hypothetical protein